MAFRRKSTARLAQWVALIGMVATIAAYCVMRGMALDAALGQTSILVLLLPWHVSLGTGFLVAHWG